MDSKLSFIYKGTGMSGDARQIFLDRILNLLMINIKSLFTQLPCIRILEEVVGVGYLPTKLERWSICVPFPRKLPRVTKKKHYKSEIIYAMEEVDGDWWGDWHIVVEQNISWDSFYLSPLFFGEENWNSREQFMMCQKKKKVWKERSQHFVVDTSKLTVKK